MAIAEGLRDDVPDCRVLVDTGEGSFKAKLKRADRSGAAYTLLLGEDELARDSIALKPMRGQAQRPVALNALAQAVSQAIAGAGTGGRASELAAD